VSKYKRGYGVSHNSNLAAREEGMGAKLYKAFLYDETKARLDQAEDIIERALSCIPDNAKMLRSKIDKFLKEGK